MKFELTAPYANQLGVQIPLEGAESGGILQYLLQKFSLLVLSSLFFKL